MKKYLILILLFFISSVYAQVERRKVKIGGKSTPSGSPSDQQILIYDGALGKWVYGTSLGGSGDMTKLVYDTNNNNIVDDSETLNNQSPSYYLDRANHTGTQTASTISDFNTAVSNNTDVTANTNHRNRTDNPHNVTKAQVGLGAIDVGSNYIISGNVIRNGNQNVIGIGGLYSNHNINEVTGQQDYRITIDTTLTYVLGGGDVISKGFASFIMSFHTKMDSKTSHSAILGGSQHYMRNCNYSAMIGGSSLTNGTKQVPDSMIDCNKTVALGSTANKTTNSDYSIIGGYRNGIDDFNLSISNTSYSSLTGLQNLVLGTQIKISAGNNQVIIGQKDTCNNNTKNCFVFGNYNTVNDARQIIFGYSNELPQGAINSVILGSHNIRPTTPKLDMVYLPKLSIWNNLQLYTGNQYEILVRDSGNEGQIKYIAGLPQYISVTHTHRDSTIKANNKGENFIAVEDGMRGLKIKKISASYFTKSTSNLQVHIHVVSEDETDADIFTLGIFANNLRNSANVNYIIPSTATYIYFETDRNNNGKGLSITLQIQ